MIKLLSPTKEARNLSIGSQTSPNTLIPTFICTGDLSDPASIVLTTIFVDKLLDASF